MRAIRPKKPGGPEVLVVSELPTPAPGRGEVLVRVEAAGVNDLDVALRSATGKASAPVLLGLEGAGVVEALGEGVDAVRVGERVAWLDVPGSYATHLVVPQARLVSLPPDVEARAAAAALRNGVTAEVLVTEAHRIRRGDACLLFAAHAGAAPCVSQVAARLGADVYAVVPNRAAFSLARESGAKHVYASGAANFVADLRARSGGVSVVYDQVGARTAAASISVLRPRGTLVFFGQLVTGPPRVDVGALGKQGSIRLTRPVLRDFVGTRDELARRAATVFGWMREGTLKVAIEGTYPLVAARLVHERLATRKTGGKFVLVP